LGGTTRQVGYQYYLTISNSLQEIFSINLGILQYSLSEMTTKNYP